MNAPPSRTHYERFLDLLRTVMPGILRENQENFQPHLAAARVGFAPAGWSVALLRAVVFFALGFAGTLGILSVQLQAQSGCSVFSEGLCPSYCISGPAGCTSGFTCQEENCNKPANTMICPGCSGSIFGNTISKTCVPESTRCALTWCPCAACCSGVED